MNRAVRIVHLDVPDHVVPGTDVLLSCHYEALQELYSIKWYRNDNEFFHYTPSLDPPKRVQSQPGIHVDVSPSVPGAAFIFSIYYNIDFNLFIYK